MYPTLFRNENSKKKKVYFNRGNLATGKVSSKNAYVEGNLLEIFKLLVNDQ